MKMDREIQNICINPLERCRDYKCKVFLLMNMKGILHGAFVGLGAWLKSKFILTVNRKTLQPCIHTCRPAGRVCDHGL